MVGHASVYRPRPSNGVVHNPVGLQEPLPRTAYVSMRCPRGERLRYPPGERELCLTTSTGMRVNASQSGGIDQAALCRASAIGWRARGRGREAEPTPPNDPSPKLDSTVAILHLAVCGDRCDDSVLESLGRILTRPHNGPLAVVRGQSRRKSTPVTEMSLHSRSYSHLTGSGMVLSCSTT